MAINKKINNEKLQHDINRKAGKMSARSTGKIDRYKYLTGEEILLSGPSQVIEQAKFASFSLGKQFENQAKIIEYQTKLINIKKMLIHN